MRSLESLGGGVVVPDTRMQHAEVVQGHRQVGVVVAEEGAFDADSAFVEALRRLGFAAGGVERAEVVAVDGELVMVRAELGLLDRHRAAVEPLGLVEAALFLDERGQGGNVGGDREVVRSEDTLAELDRSARVGFAGGVAAAGVLDAAEVVPDRRLRELVGRVFQRATVEGFGVVEAGGVLVDDGEIVQDRGGLRVVGAEARFGGLERGLQTRFCGVQPAEHPLDTREPRLREHAQAVVLDGCDEGDRAPVLRLGRGVLGPLLVGDATGDRFVCEGRVPAHDAASTSLWLSAMRQWSPESAQLGAAGAAAGVAASAAATAAAAMILVVCMPLMLAHAGAREIGISP
ncbi:MAG: hypothetical protein QOF76_4993 [Solirubrobacteraceae bacterium]|nr:hypothetical protein [Solirubrobacteraceae bacterium]